jgi:hypothetical protein
MKIGEAQRAQASSLYSATPIGAPIHPAPIGVADRTQKNFIGALCLVIIAYWRRGTSVRQYIGAPRAPCANILALRGPPARPLLVLERDKSLDFSISCNKFHIAYWRTEHFGAPCLFSSQSPINWALQTGNGNTLRKRRWQH